MVAMKGVVLLALGALLVAFLGCQASTPAVSPTPPSPSYIAQSAIENLNAASSFHVSALSEAGDGSASLEIDYVSSGKYRIVRTATGADGSVDESTVIVINNKGYGMVPGFQAWVVLEGEENDTLEVEEVLEGVYDILSGVTDEVSINQEDFDGTPVFRLRAPVPEDLLRSLPLGPGQPQPKFDIRLDQDELLPLHMEILIEDPKFALRFVFSNYEEVTGVAEPDHTFDITLLGRLFEGGPFTAKEVAQLVNALPLATQGCLKSELGDEAYNKMTSGEGDPTLFIGVAFGFPCANIINKAALGQLRHGNPSSQALHDASNGMTKSLKQYQVQCIFALWGDQKFEEILAGSRPLEKVEMADMLDCSAAFVGRTHLRDYLDLADFSIAREDVDGDVLACLHEALGLRVLVEIGIGEWDPRPDQMDAIAHCVP